jgi:hypothetical protein
VSSYREQDRQPAEALVFVPAALTDAEQCTEKTTDLAEDLLVAKIRAAERWWALAVALAAVWFAAVVALVVLYPG